jgi:DNA-binding Lrp family transcriptional regulator
MVVLSMMVGGQSAGPSALFEKEGRSFAESTEFDEGKAARDTVMVLQNEDSTQSLDAIDARILALVRTSARLPNAQIAAAAGIAQSTAHARLRSLESRGIIAGYETVVDQAKLGIGLQALIGVTIRPGARQSSISSFATDTHALAEVTQLFFVGGSDDYIVHVAVQDASALRRFVVDHLSGHPSVASTRTSIIFEYSRNGVIAPFH